jgi:2-polyprenyl-3-methyl-5-hydroxy-6-metoxy-1,4-benzoquinol methylase
VLDVGAGTGLLSRPLLGAGVLVLAIDVSRDLLEVYARLGENGLAVAQARAAADGAKNLDPAAIQQWLQPLAGSSRKGSGTRGSSAPIRSPSACA